jgi:hypothetical protein
MFIPKSEVEKLLEKIKMLEEEKDLTEEKEYENLDIADSIYEELQEKNLILKDKNEFIEKIQSEYKELKNQIQILNEIDRKHLSNWHINIDIAWRINELTYKQEIYKIPKNFDINKVYDVTPSDDLKWVSFRYEDDKNKLYKIPRSLGEDLKIIDPINKWKNQDKIDIKKIHNKKDIRYYIESRESNTKTEYWNSIIDFLSWYRGIKFKKSKFIKECKIRNLESARNYLNKLIKIGLIERVIKGEYKVLFDYN